MTDTNKKRQEIEFIIDSKMLKKRIKSRKEERIEINNGIYVNAVRKRTQDINKENK